MRRGPAGPSSPHVIRTGATREDEALLDPVAAPAPRLGEPQAGVADPPYWLACEAGHVEVELLVVADCPNGVTASRALLEAARLAGVEDDLRVNVTVVKTDDEAQRLGFGGSPTFLIGGVDPFAVPGAAFGVTCRVYRVRCGVSVVPDVEELREALVRACAFRSSATDGR